MKRRYFISEKVLAVLVVLMITVVLSSCKKDDPEENGGAYEMSFTANGTKVKYTTQGALVASFANSGSQFLGVLTGYDANTNLHVQVYDDEAIVAGTYSGYSASGGVLTGVLIGYKDGTGTSYTQAGGDIVVTISSITETSASGTFIGTLKASGKPDMVITDGKFTVQRFDP